jgi:hypothetical protein
MYHVHNKKEQKRRLWNFELYTLYDAWCMHEIHVTHKGNDVMSGLLVLVLSFLSVSNLSREVFCNHAILG